MVDRCKRKETQRISSGKKQCYTTGFLLGSLCCLHSIPSILWHILGWISTDGVACPALLSAGGGIHNGQCHTATWPQEKTLTQARSVDSQPQKSTMETLRLLRSLMVFTWRQLCSQGMFSRVWIPCWLSHWEGTTVSYEWKSGINILQCTAKTIWPTSVVAKWINCSRGVHCEYVQLSRPGRGDAGGSGRVS